MDVLACRKTGRERKVQGEEHYSYTTAGTGSNVLAIRFWEQRSFHAH
uniref:Uncharacterized protein n=1 Tax=Medicago truncatula TaxID=3880 RepID=A4PRI9_MEDTR|nr:hypothetical protein MtrDRAFT_AC139526g45v2 [Medicago truncatula]